MRSFPSGHATIAGSSLMVFYIISQGVLLRFSKRKRRHYTVRIHLLCRVADSQRADGGHGDVVGHGIGDTHRRDVKRPTSVVRLPALSR